MPSPLAVAQDDLVLRMLMGGRDALGLTQGAKKQRPRSACGRRLKADVHRREDVQRIYRSLGQADCSLQRDMQVGASYLPRGSRLLREGPVKRGRPLKAALEAICLPASLLFEAPPKDAWEAPRAHKTRGAAAADAAAGLLHGVASYDWCCPLPCCRAPYPVQAPIETTARALLARLVPEIVDFEPPATDLWTNCGLQDTARARRGDPELVEGAPPCTALADEQGHELDEYRAPSDGFGCGQCGAHIETSDTMRGCIDCRFFVCMPCFARALDSGGFDLRPLPPPHELRRQRERQDRERTLRALVDSAPGHFDLSPVLHFGRVRRRPPMHGKERPEDARLLRRGPSGELVPLADPYAYYARAALLHAGAEGCATAKERDKTLHEARDALLAALGGEALGAGAAPACASRRPPAAAGRQPGQTPPPACAADDPRVLYLLGLVLCDLGAFSEAQRLYRQVLGKLPMAHFGRAVHFNLACLHAVQCRPSEAERALRDFRRSCQDFSPVGAAGAGSPCELCGAPVRP